MFNERISIYSQYKVPLYTIMEIKSCSSCQMQYFRDIPKAGVKNAFLGISKTFTHRFILHIIIGPHKH